VLLVVQPLVAAQPAPTPGWAVRIVGLAMDAPMDLLAGLAQRAGGEVLRADPALKFAVMAAPAAEALEALAVLPGVAYVERVQRAEPLALTTTDPLVPDQWGLPAVRAPEAWDALSDAGRASRATIAVLDTGVDWRHPDLADVLWDGNGLHGWDLTMYATALDCSLGFLVRDGCFAAQQPPEEVAGPMDFAGHGTHVAGIAAAARDGQGVAGVSTARVLAVKVLPYGSSVWSTTDVLASGIALAALEGADVISMSLGCACASATLERAVQVAWLKGSVLVAAAGNSDSDAPFYPAAFPEVLSVAALGPDLQPWRWAPGLGTNHGPTVDLAAPGEDVLSAASRWTTSYGHVYRGLGWVRMTGTSMAAPHVAGVAALVVEANPGLSNAQVVEVLERSADDLGAPGRDDAYGWGLVDAQAAVRLAMGTIAGGPVH
jgi:subtilisin family serine protease